MKRKSYSFYDKQIIVNSDGAICKDTKELLKSDIFKEVLQKYLQSLLDRKSPLLDIFPEKYDGQKSQYNEILNLLQLLAEYDQELILKKHAKFKEFFNNIYLLNQFVEELYNFWRNYERFFVLHSSKELKFHKKPFRSFNMSIEHLNNLVRWSYRDICENITGDHPLVYRQVPAGFQLGLITKESKINAPEKYSIINKIPVIKQILIEPPLIINPPMNKRSGLFRRIDSNPFSKLTIKSEEWLCYPAKVGELLIMIYFHEKNIGLGCSLANLFDLAQDYASKKPDAIYFYGVNEEELSEFKAPRTLFYDDEENDLMVGFVPQGDVFGYFGYIKKMVLTLHNIISMKKNRLPVHGAMVRIELKNGKSKNVVIIGDSGAGKSESLEAFRILSDEHLRDMVIIFDDMGSLDKIDNELKAFGTETGAFVRLDDLRPGFVYGNLDRSIIMNPDKVNARAVLPITTIKEVIDGQDVDMILYANNYEKVDNKDYLKFFDDWKTAFEVFKKGTRMAKSTTSEVGLTNSYFANPFGAPQYKDLHENLAKEYFKFFFEKGIKVGEIKTMLGIEGYENKGPENAAKALFKFISEMN